MCLNYLESYAVRGLTKSDPLALHVWGLNTGLTSSNKKVFVTETAAKQTTLLGVRGPSESLEDVSGGSQP